MHWLHELWKLEEEIALLQWRKTNAADSSSAALQGEISHKEENKKELVDLIKTFRGLDNQILLLKYVHGKTLEVIADELGYSYSHISKKHAEIIRTIKAIKSYTAFKEGNEL